MPTSPSPESKAAVEMPVPARSLTLIVAATLDRGIGQNGTLPWPSLKSEMAYFARVTKRPPASLPQGTKNAVIMGRKTWESIPEKYRPLRGRVNCVVSTTLKEKNTSRAEEPRSVESSDDEIVFAGSLEEGVDALTLRAQQPADEHGKSSESDAVPPNGIGHIFIIGGASIYASALKLQRADRILLTKITKPNFECDTFFPLDLESNDAKQQGWQRKGTQELEAFSGEFFGNTGTARREGDVEYDFCLYGRAQAG